LSNLWCLHDNTLHLQAMPLSLIIWQASQAGSMRRILFSGWWYCLPGTADFVPANKISPKFKQVHESFLSPKLFSAKVKRLFCDFSLWNQKMGKAKALTRMKTKKTLKKYVLQQQPANIKVKAQSDVKAWNRFCLQHENRELKMNWIYCCANVSKLWRNWTAWSTSLLKWRVFNEVFSLTFTLQKCNQSKDCIFCINLPR